MVEPTEMHPHADFMKTSIDYNESYYITPDGVVVHVLNVDEYFVNVMKCQVFKKED